MKDIVLKNFYSTQCNVATAHNIAKAFHVFNKKYFNGDMELEPRSVVIIKYK